jgi:thymidine phosphorylase
VGIVFVPKIGDQILTHDVIGQVHARTEEDAHTAIARVRSAIDIADEPVESPPLVHRWFGPPEAQ